LSKTGRVILRRQLDTFDVTSLVVGSIIGADIYVAAALGAKLVGPASLALWVVAGVMAIVIALSFAYCATVLPRVGGPYSYVKEVAGQFNGFIVGWALLLAEWSSLAVFPVAFTQYFLSLVKFDEQSQIVLKGVFILAVFATNIVGVKLAGRFNDSLTVGKLSPLLLLTVSGLLFIGLKPEAALSNFQPFLKGDGRSLGQALVLIFWAYAGFELSTLPAGEIQKPRITIPKAIVMGMLIVTTFYLVTNFVIVGVVDQDTLASSQAPLIVATSKIFSSSLTLLQVGVLIVGIGALISIMGADESGTIGTSRLAFAMSVDGLLPHVFSRLHRHFRTPYIGLALICSVAFIASVIGTLTALINASVFLLSVVYFSTCLSAILLRRKRLSESHEFRWGRAVPTLGIVFSLLLMTQVETQQILTACFLLAIGIPLYAFFSPKKELPELRDVFLSRDAILRRAYDQGEKFLAYPIRRINWLIYRAKRVSRAWHIQENS